MIGNHKTSEHASLVSHGLIEHLPKFHKCKGSLAIYLYFLFYAKHTGPQKGTLMFETIELSKLLSNKRNGEKVHRSTVIRVIHFLDSIGMIKIIQQPKNQNKSLWIIKIEKYKSSWTDFRTVFKTDPPDTKKESAVASDATAEKKPVAQTQQRISSHRTNITALDANQLEMFDDRNETLRKAQNPKPLLHSCNMDKSSNFVPEWALALPDPKIALFLASLIEDIDTNNNIYSFFNTTKIKNKDKEVEYILQNIKQNSFQDKSSEEIISPDLAIRITNQLFQLMKSKEFDSKKYNHADRKARNEFIRLYWNHLRVGGKRPFRRVMSLNQHRKNRLDKLFIDSKIFRDYWPYAMTRVLNSKYCRGETSRSDWIANFEWFIRKDSAVVNAIEGMYDDRSAPEGKIQRRVQGTHAKSNYLTGVPLDVVLPEDLNDWIKANPRTAAQAREQGLLGMPK